MTECTEHTTKPRRVLRDRLVQVLVGGVGQSVISIGRTHGMSFPYVPGDYIHLVNLKIGGGAIPLNYCQTFLAFLGVVGVL